MYSNYVPRNKYWKTQTKIDHRPIPRLAQTNPPRSSLYRYKKVATPVSSSYAARYSNTLFTAGKTTSNLKVTNANSVFRTAPLRSSNVSLSKSPLKSTCYINPHFQANTNVSVTKQDPKDLPTSPVHKVIQTSASSSLSPKDKLNSTRHIHVNPDVYVAKPDASTSVYVNPMVFARLKLEVKKENPCLNNNSISATKYVRNNKSLISPSNAKLVRGRKVSVSTPRSRLMSATRLTFSPLVKVAKSVCSKYRYIRNSPANSTKTPLKQVLQTKYKLDRRENRTPKYAKLGKYSLKYDSSKRKSLESNLQGIMLRKKLSSSKKSPFGNRVWANNGSLQPKRVIITNRKLFKIGSSPVVKINPRSRIQSSTLVRIGDILYKTSRTQLTRTGASKPKSLRNNLNKSRTPVTRKKCGAGHIVHVRGNKFIMDPSGKTLKRVLNDKQLNKNVNMKRIDIGGATFIQKSANVLIRTNTQAVRSLLSQVKQRSIALLVKPKRKNNIICQFYRRFGKCFRNEKGRCPCIHDSKYVAICKRFVSGSCTREGCLLSHNLIPEKMPTCKYFLQACCVRDNCTYIHVKLDSTAPLCIGFLQGYCADGLKCSKWHFNICPQFDKTGKCPKGKYCPFPHKPREHLELSNDHLEFNPDYVMAMYMEHLKNKKEYVPEKMIRYFSTKEEEVGDCDKNESSDDSLERASVSEDEDVDEESCGDDTIKVQHKIGLLPSYVPL